MSPTTPRVSDALHTIAPWIAATAACLIAAVLMSQFIDTLHLSIQRGESLRAGLAASVADTSSGTIHLASATVPPRH